MSDHVIEMTGLVLDSRPYKDGYYVDVAVVGVGSFGVLAKHAPELGKPIKVRARLFVYKGRLGARAEIA